MYRSIVLLVAGLASLGAISLSAQEAVLSQQYGSGVHSYFAANYAKAYEQLTTAIDGGLKDPRAFYFRGLACLDLGRPQDAKLDFHAGAALEADNVNKLYNVGKSFERIQGPAREELEGYRINARMAALEREEQIQRIRYGKAKESGGADINSLASGPKDVPSSASGGEENANPDPFAVEGDQPKKAVKKAPPEKPDENVSPFGDDEEDQPAAATPDKKAGKAGKTDKKPPKAGSKAAGSEPDPFAKPAEKPEGKSDGNNGERREKGQPHRRRRQGDPQGDRRRQEVVRRQRELGRLRRQREVRRLRR